MIRSSFIINNNPKQPLHPPAEVVEDHHVGVGVVEVVHIGWVLLAGPVTRQWAVSIKHDGLWLGLIIHRVKSCHLPTNTIIRIGATVAVYNRIWMHSLHVC